MKRLIFIIPLLFIGCGSQSDATKIFNRNVESVVGVGDDTQMWGCGVAVGRHTIATCNHCVVGQKIKIYLDGQVVDGKVFSQDVANDLALVNVDVDLKPVKLCLRPVVGESVVIIGHPFGYKNMLITGVVGRLTEPWIQVNATINPGNSGGPVFNSRGELLGLVSSMRGIGLGWCVPAKCIARHKF